MLNKGWLLRSAMLSFVCMMLLATMPANGTRIRAAHRIQKSSRTIPLFDFHSNFWVNLHQVLRHEALLRAGKPDRRLQSNTPLTTSQMSDAGKVQWNAVVDFYFKTFVTREGVFDSQLIQINDTLAKQPDDGASLNPAGLPADLVAVLQSAAPIYRKLWWRAHDASNKQWIASQAERVKKFGPQIAAAMTKDLHEPWPAVPVRVDICYYVAEIGHAYTTSPPPHTTFSSSAPTLQGLNGLEVLFHEASHSFADTMTNALFAECGAQKKNCGQLWHAVLFYTPGVEVRRALPPMDQATFTPYAYKYGLYTHGDWPKYRIALEKDWQAYLDGKIDLAAAIHSMVKDLQ